MLVAVEPSQPLRSPVKIQQDVTRTRGRELISSGRYLINGTSYQRVIKEVQALHQAVLHPSLLLRVGPDVRIDRHTRKIQDRIMLLLQGEVGLRHPSLLSPLSFYRIIRSLFPPPRPYSSTGLPASAFLLFPNANDFPLLQSIAERCSMRLHFIVQKIEGSLAKSPGSSVPRVPLSCRFSHIS